MRMNLYNVKSQDSSNELVRSMSQTPLYPLRFEPIYQYRPWGGRRLAKLLKPRRCPAMVLLAKPGCLAIATTALAA